MISSSQASTVLLYVVPHGSATTTKVILQNALIASSHSYCTLKTAVNGSAPMFATSKIAKWCCVLLVPI